MSSRNQKAVELDQYVFILFDKEDQLRDQHFLAKLSKVKKVHEKSFFYVYVIETSILETSKNRVIPAIIDFGCEFHPH